MAHLENCYHVTLLFPFCCQIIMTAFRALVYKIMNIVEGNLACCKRRLVNEEIIAALSQGWLNTDTFANAYTHTISFIPFYELSLQYVM